MEIFKKLKNYFIEKVSRDEEIDYPYELDKKVSYDLFLSYSSNDRKAIIEPLYHVLKDEGFKPWFDIKEIKWGDSIVQKMQDGIANTKIIIFFISKSYLKKPWTLKELRSIVAMQQISDSQIIFPILLGVTEKELIQSVPFLADIKYLKIENYSHKEKVEKKYFKEIIKELERVKDKLKPFKLKRFVHICTLSKSIEVATFGSHYRYYSIITKDESLEIHQNKSEPAINLNFLIKKLFKELNINHTFKISSIGSNPTHSCIHLIVLNNGNIFIIHRVNIHNISQLKNEDYIQINAPKNPSISILSDNTNEVFLGYDDRSIYVWNKKGIQLKKLQSAIIAIDMSLESIVVAVSKNGEIGIWIRNIYQLKKYIDTKNAITSLSVSRTRVRYSKKGIFATGHRNGIVTFWNFDGIEINKYSLTKQAIVAMCFFPFGLEYIGIATKKM